MATEVNYVDPHAPARVPLAVALVLALVTLCSAPVASEDRPPDPEASGSDVIVGSAEGVAETPFSPERLSWLLPARIGNTEMISLDLSPDEVEARLEASTALREMLESGGKDPTRLHMAEGFMAEGFDDELPDEALYWIDALRVDGWGGHDTLRHVLAPQLSAPDLVDTALELTSRKLDDGREVFVLDHEGAAFHLAYPDGDVLYLIQAKGGLGLDEFMAQTGIGGQRVKIGDVSLTAPQPWFVEETTAASHSWLYGPSWDGLVYLTDGEFDCSVLDTTRYASGSGLETVDDAVAWELGALEGMDDSARARILSRLADEPEDVSSTILELPFGRVGVIDISDADWWNSRTYVFEDDGRWAYLYCSDTFEPPEGRWLSIAESLEFLPAEE